MLDKLTSADFTPYVHQLFRIRLEDDATLDVELVSVQELGDEEGSSYQRDPTRRRPFSLIFRGPRAPSLPQRIYHVEHDQVGALDIFLVPIGPGEGGMDYEAIFT
jgi:hypothetical protein